MLAVCKIHNDQIYEKLKTDPKMKVCVCVCVCARACMCFDAHDADA